MPAMIDETNIIGITTSNAGMAMYKGSFIFWWLNGGKECSVWTYTAGSFYK